MMRKHLNRFSDLLLLLLCTYSIVSMILSSFNCTVDSLFPLYILVLCLALWFGSSFRRGMLIGLPVSLLTVYIAYRSYADDILFESADLLDKLTGAYYEHIYAPGSSYPFLNQSPAQDFTLILLIFLILIYLAPAITSTTWRIPFSLIGAVPIFAACIAVNGFPPKAAVICFVLFCLLLFAGGNNGEDSSNRGRAVFITALPLALCLCATLYLQRPDEYSFDDGDITLSQRFDAIGKKLSQFLGEQAVETTFLDAEATGSLQEMPTSVPSLDLDEIDLNQAYDSSSQNSHVLTASSSRGGLIYLRGNSYGEYTGSGWRAADDNSPVSSLAFTARAIASSEELLDVRFAGSSALLYLPYYSTLGGSSDTHVASNAQREYSLRYSSYAGDPSLLSLSGDYAAAELEYRDYAHEYYTRLPEQTMLDMQSLLNQAGIYVDSANLVQQVAQFIKDSCDYDLNTQAYNSSDHAIYFITTAETGYCVHFATAATVAYRALGIPARFTEGFLFSAVAGEETKVYGKNAHAWVEVYFDAVGWVPIEVTGSAAITEPQPDSDSAALPDPVSTGPIDGEALAPDVSIAPATPSPSPATLPVGFIAPPEEADEQTPENSGWLIAAIVLTILLIAFFPLCRMFLLYFNRKAVGHSNARKAAVAIWHRAERVSGFGVAPLAEEIIKCAERASFSRHEIGDDELQACSERLDSMTRETYQSLSGFKKFVFKYLHGLI